MKTVLPPYGSVPVFILSHLARLRRDNPADKVTRLPLNNLADSLKVVLSDKPILDILFYFLSWKTPLCHVPPRQLGAFHHVNLAYFFNMMLN